MFAFDRQRFFADFPGRTGLVLTESRRAALDQLLTCFESDAAFTMVRELAYVLATIRWETGHTFLPIEERRAHPQRQAQLYRRQSDYWGFHGRGYVQITWDRNYKRACRELEGRTYDVDGTPLRVAGHVLAERPELVMHPAISYDIASSGMRKGWFTGKKLSDYIREGSVPDYVSARRIINGLDHAADIAGYAEQFELLLRSAEATAPAARRAGRKRPTAVRRARGKRAGVARRASGAKRSVGTPRKGEGKAVGKSKAVTKRRAVAKRSAVTKRRAPRRR